MGYVDFILNLAGLLLWMKWRLQPFDPFNQRTPATLVGTLRRAAPSRFRRWHLLAGIVLLLVLRAVIYWWIGFAFTQPWVGKLHLGVTVLPFRTDWLLRSVGFSFFSFGLTLAVFYLWLLLLSLLDGRSAAADPVHRLIRVQLGRIEGWPGWAKMILPFCGGFVCWWAASWLFVWLRMVPGPVSAWHRIEESLLIGLGGYLAWKFVAVALLVLYLLNSYVYFGRHPFWSYVDVTARNLLSPLNKIPLQAGRVNFAPVVGIIIIFLAAGFMERGLIWLYARLPL